MTATLLPTHRRHRSSTAKTEAPNDEDVNNNGQGMVIIMVDVVIVAALCCRPPLANDSYQLTVLPPPLSLQRGKDKGAG